MQLWRHESRLHAGLDLAWAAAPASLSDANVGKQDWQTAETTAERLVLHP